MASFAPIPTEHRVNAASARDFILAGNATFTLRSLKTGNRYTYKVEIDPRPGPGKPVMWFAMLLTGPENTSDYTYIGAIFTQADGTLRFRTTSASKMPATSTPVVAFAWAFGSIIRGQEPKNAEIWHVGRCGRCGRVLTVPESVALGIGPECARRGAGA